MIRWNCTAKNKVAASWSHELEQHFCDGQEPHPNERVLPLDMKAERITPCLGDIEQGLLAQLSDVLPPLVHIANLSGGEAYVTRSVLILKNEDAQKTNESEQFVRNLRVSFQSRAFDCIEKRRKTWSHYEPYEIVTSLYFRPTSLACIGVKWCETVWL